MRKVRTGTALLVLLLTAVALFANGSGEAEEKTLDMSAPADISLFIASKPPAHEIADTPIGAQILEKLNVNLDITYTAGDAETMIGVMIASGDYPDMIWALREPFLEAEAIIPLDDLIDEYGENIKFWYPQEELDYHRVGDGKIYNITSDRSFAPNTAVGAFCLQKAAVEELGYPSIRTVEQYFDAIRQYKAQNPTIAGKESIGFVAPVEGWRFSMSVNETCKWLAGWQNDATVYVEEIGGKYIPKVVAGTPEQKRWIKTLNEINAEGLLDLEMFTMNHEQYIQRLSSGRVIGWFDFTWSFNPINAALKQQDMKERGAFIFPVTFDGKTPERYHALNHPNTTRGMMLSVNNEQPERSMTFLSDMLDEDIYKLMKWGVAGEDYSIDENGKFYHTEEQLAAWRDSATNAARGLNCLGFPFPRPTNTQSYSDGNVISPNDDPVNINKWNTDQDDRILAAYGVEKSIDLFNVEKAEPWGYTWTINIPADHEAKIVSTQLDDLQFQYMSKAVLSSPDKFESVWAEYMEKLGKINTGALEDYYKKVIAMRVEANNPNLQLEQ